MDTGKRLSDNAASTVVNITGPVAPLVSHTIVDDDVVLTWVKPSSSFTVVAYSLSYTHPIDGLKQLGTVDTTTLRFQVDCGGSATFHVSAILSAAFIENISVPPILLPLHSKMSPL